MTRHNSPDAPTLVRPAAPPEGWHPSRDPYRRPPQRRRDPLGEAVFWKASRERAWTAAGWAAAACFALIALLLAAAIWHFIPALIRGG